MDLHVNGTTNVIHERTSNRHRTPYMSRITALRLSFAVVALVATLACADSATPTAPRAASTPSVEFAKARDPEKSKVAVCKLQKEAWATAQIGSRGGRVSVGGSTLTVPPGALQTTVAITAHALPTTSASIQLLPEGLQFAVPASLSIPYAKCETPLFGVGVVYVQADTVTEVEPSTNHPILKFVTAQIRHFSSYAVAY
jgi:hypothetical protein